MSDDTNELEEIMDRLEDMAESPGSDDVIQLYGNDSGFSEPYRSEFGSIPGFREDNVMYTTSSG